MKQSNATYKDFYVEEIKSSVQTETKKTLSQKYSAIVIDKESKEKLLNKFGEIIPDEWTIKCHHMTIDPYNEIKIEQDNSITLMVTAIGMSKKAIAVKVVGYKGEIKNKLPHITLAINEKDGAAAKDSNQIENWIPIKDNIVLTGTIQNIAKGISTNTKLSESPLKTYTTLGFDRNDKGGFKNKSFGDDIDRKLITDPNSVKKVAKVFSHCPVDIDLYFVNKKGIKQFEEYGKVNSVDLIFNEVPEGLGIKPSQLKNEKINEDSITVFYVGNYGSEKVPLTPWIIAHRFSHALRARGKNQYWDYMFDEWFSSEIKMIFDEYGIKIDIKGFNSPKELCYFYNKIGTMRSARENKITRAGEFHHELFAQYLSTGKITLNPLDAKIQLGYGGFGHKKYYRAKDIDFVNEILQRIENTFPIYANDVLHAAIGNILIM